MRSVRSEILSASVALAVPALLALVFPYEAVGFRADVRPRQSPVTASFVTLKPEEEKAALATAKTSWQTAVSAGRRKYARLSLGELPADAVVPVILDDGDSPAMPADDAVAYGRVPWSPSAAARSPERIAASEPAEAKRAFSRRELLELKEK